MNKNKPDVEKGLVCIFYTLFINFRDETERHHIFQKRHLIKEATIFKRMRNRFYNFWEVLLVCAMSQSQKGTI